MKTFILSGDSDTDRYLTENDMSELQWSMLSGCSHQGACDEDVDAATRYFDIEDYSKAHQHLINCGIEEDRFIDENNDRDDHAILEYYLWILSGDIQDSEDENESN